jgi:hypothetical protein
LFRDCIEGQAKNGAFVTKGFSSWNKKDRLDVHASKLNGFHNAAVKRCNNLLKPDQSIIVGLNKQRCCKREIFYSTKIYWQLC